MTINDQSNEKLQEIFENAIKIVVLTKEDVTKTLAASGVSQEEDIAFILAKDTSDLPEDPGKAQGTSFSSLSRKPG